MTTIKFGTDGWRAIIAERFITQNVARLTQGVADWLLAQELPNKVVIAIDCRFAGDLFADIAARVFTRAGIEVCMSDRIATTPMLSLAVRDFQCGLGVMFTASHNPASYHGYKLKTHLGGPMGGTSLTEIEALIPATFEVDALPEAKTTSVDIETPYVEAIEARFDMKALRAMSSQVSYDAMYGSGQFVMRRLFPEMDLFRCEHNPHFYGLSPEPIARNLGELSEHMRENEKLRLAIITDGDADRIGLMNGQGEVLDAHHIIALLVHYLHHYEGRSGKVVTAFSTVDAVERLCEKYGLPFHVVKIGFKYASAVMVEEPVMVAGEESGGIADPAHIPERDGIWIGLTLLEALAKTGKSLEALIDEVYAEVGSFRFLRNDLRLTDEKKRRVVEQCRAGQVGPFGPHIIEKTEDMDGWKFRIGEGRWVMIRPSGTEPVLRIYVQAEDEHSAQGIMQDTLQWIDRLDA